MCVCFCVGAGLVRKVTNWHVAFDYYVDLTKMQHFGLSRQALPNGYFVFGGILLAHGQK